MNDDLMQFMHSEEGKIAMQNTGNAWEAIRTGPTQGPRKRREQLRYWYEEILQETRRWWA